MNNQSTYCGHEQESSNMPTAKVAPDPNDGKQEKEKEKKEEETPAMVSISTLFRYATGVDKLLMFLGTFCGVIHGALMPISFIVFGELITVFTVEYQNIASGQDPGAAKRLETSITDLALYFVYIGIGNVVITYGQMAFWSLAAARQLKQMRLHFFQAILNQDIGWFDCNDPGELNNRLTADLNKVNDGIGHKVGLFIQPLATFLGGFAVGFYYGWELTLVLLSVTPLMVISGAIMAKMFTSLTTKELDAYARAGSIAEEVFSSIRTVAAFGGEEKEYQRYNGNLKEAKDFGIKKGIVTGLGMGTLQIIMFGSYALSFWYGSTLIIDKTMKAGDMIIVFFSVMMAGFSLGQAGPNFEAFSSARAAAYKVFQIIDRVSLIDPSSQEGEKPDSVTGNIEFKNINFVYPSREDVKVLKDFNLAVSSGQTVALVGESGCGKSTVVKLIQRFYDPQGGEVLLDGKDINSLNVAWLRHHIGVVSQEPVLFATTISENIRYGEDGLSQEDIKRAAQMANAHDFILNLPEGYDTLVGERGAQLSGGQKQRIAIARALVRDPKILLLDEATSALDTESESVVQAALDKAREGRTTIVIAHRLSTVKNANVIAAIQDGTVVEMGTHSELMKTEGVYRQLVTLQTFEEDENQEMDNDVIEEKDASAALHFMKSMSSLSSGEENVASGLDRKLSARASRRLSQRKHRPGSAFDKQKSELGDKTKEKAAEEQVEPAPVKRILKLNKSEWPYISLGVFASIGIGVYPLAFAELISEVLNVFTIPSPEEQKEKAIFWSLLFLALGGGGFLCYLVSNWSYAISGEILTLRLRQSAFKTIIRQSMSYFDEPAHSTGALCTVLSTHAADVKGATGSRIGSVVSSITMAIACATYAFVHDWRMTLLVVAFTPFFVVSGAIQAKIFIGKDEGNEDEQLETGKVAVEAIENIRTIASLGLENVFHEKFAKTLQAPHKKAVKKAHFYGASFGMSEAIMYWSEAAAFRFGAYLIAQHDLTYLNMLRVIFCVMMGAMSAGEMSAYSPDYAKAKVAAARLFKVFDCPSAIDSSSEEGAKPSHCEGGVSLRAVKFHYPSRPNANVLRGMDLVVKPGQRLALVGASGCGKSTVVSLLERFYDVITGEVVFCVNKQVFPNRFRNYFATKVPVPATRNEDDRELLSLGPEQAVMSYQESLTVHFTVSLYFHTSPRSVFGLLTPNNEQAMDGSDVKSLNIKWLRSQMGIVSQEPVLFSYSIADNIAYGDNSRQIRLEDIEAAAKMANIHSFINSLPKGYDTNVGDKGTLISGGQKQRIAIARALIRNPRILLLDEATSALDTESEKVVQEALDKASEGRTTIVIAHRLSTVQNADSIAVLHRGRIVEQGTHQDLLALKGTYYSLVTAQVQPGNGNEDKQI